MRPDPLPNPPLIAQKHICRLVFDEFDSVNAWAKKYKQVQSTINRIVTGKQDPTTSMLEKIAQALTSNGRPTQAWQFLDPNFGAGLHTVTTEAGKTSVVPIIRPVDKQGSGMRPIGSPWDRKNHPNRRATDQKQGGE